MMPSDVADEVNKFKKNPSRYLLFSFAAVLISVGCFYFSKYVSGEINSACESPLYYLKESEYCGVLEYKSGAADVCGVDLYKECESGLGCGWIKLGGKINIGKVKAKECRASQCGVERYKTCKNEVFGVEKYKTCRIKEHGIEKCNDVPPWKFWIR